MHGSMEMMMLLVDVMWILRIGVQGAWMKWNLKLLNCEFYFHPDQYLNILLIVCRFDLPSKKQH